MAASELNWVKVAENEKEIPFNENNLAEIITEERVICLGRHNGEMFAFAARCPHASGLFVNSYIDAMGNVVCPIHRYKFCMRNGKNVTGEGYFLKNWPVELREDGVFVGLQKSLLNLI
ncbi:MAG TPA: Rieske 2Fe-2S domain-containing protein [Chitinophagaceae bacterium]|nr:Rieske 2Fe-2S domain-containing protein [Chitinophagaceae bacterium]